MPGAAAGVLCEPCVREIAEEPVALHRNIVDGTILGSASNWARKGLKIEESALFKRERLAHVPEDDLDASRFIVIVT